MKIRPIITVILFLLSVIAQAEDSGVAMYVCQDISDAKERELCVSRATQTISDKNRVVSSRESSGVSLGFFSIFWPWAWWALYYGFGLLIGLYLFRDCKSREWVFLGIRPIIWLLLAVFNPGLTLIAYWLMHYSRFAMTYSEAKTSINDPTKME
jgi:hypothetical protein